MSMIVARYNTSEAASRSAILRTAEAAGAATFTAEHDSATDTFVVVKHEVS